MSYRVVASGEHEPRNMFQEFIDSDDEDEPQYDSEDDVYDFGQREDLDFIKHEDQVNREFAMREKRKNDAEYKEVSKWFSNRRAKILRKLDRGLSVLPPQKWIKLIENSNFFMELLLTKWQKVNIKYKENHEMIRIRASKLFFKSTGKEWTTPIELRHYDAVFSNVPKSIPVNEIARWESAAKSARREAAEQRNAREK